MMCNPQLFSFETTEELQPITSGIGQDRGIKALEFGINVDIKPLTLEEKQLVLDWQNARKEKNFELADKYRAQITESGIEL